MLAAVVFGTRPEAIKMAPVIRALHQADGVDCLALSTGQHREMLQQVLDLFDLQVDDNLDVMTAGQTLNGVFSAVLSGMDGLLERRRPDVLLVHGDTTTAAAAATAAFNRGIPIAHVEAGLRSGRMDQPWPEEFNRRLVDMVSSQLFAPTECARANLLAEGVPDSRIIVTGNTVVDALLDMVARIEARPEIRRRLDERFAFLRPDLPTILVTGHRRENIGEGFRNVCKALEILGESGARQIVYPVHMNPGVSGPVHALLSGRPHIHLIETVDYESFVYLMMRCTVILTDSGGVQEEAPSLGKPVLVMRNVTERTEAVEFGVAELVGTDTDQIVSRVLAALASGFNLSGINPYGDGQAACRIVKGLKIAPDPLR